jgi:hypothetical protein
MDNYLQRRGDEEMYRKHKNIKAMLVLPMIMALISTFSIPALAANPSQVVSKVSTSLP